MWGPCGSAIGGAWWIFPLLGLVFMVVMMVFCARVMPGMMGGGMCGHGGRRREANEVSRGGDRGRSG